MKYFISGEDISWSENRWVHKGPLFGRYKGGVVNGKIGLFDRNSGKYTWFKIIKKCINRYGWIVERKSKIPTYWNKAIRPQTQEEE